MTDVDTIIDGGGDGHRISADRLHAHLEQVAQSWVLDAGVKRLLLLPPDHTRLHSMAGQICAWLWKRLSGSIEVSIMPTIGTHVPMTREQCDMMFGAEVPFERIIAHDWRVDLASLGTVPAEKLSELSGGKFEQSANVELSRHVVDDSYDLVLSVGQVVPHEVIGMANYTKNVCIGAGGKDFIHKSHFLGAVCGMESIMGRADTPVRQFVDHAFDEFVRPRANVKFLLTVIHDEQLAGLYAGSDRSCFSAAAKLAQALNVIQLDEPIERCVVRLPESEFHSTWLGNKAIYRTRMAMADGGRLIILGPGVTRFGEDAKIDTLIRKHGYKGTEPTLAAVGSDEGMSANLAAAAHLIHGSTEGRFDVTYCPSDQLSQAEIESVGYDYGRQAKIESEFDLSAAQPGWNEAPDGGKYFYIANPGLGLWSTRERFETA